jgi:glycosyltransferase involved in cell wall biosynthesis
MATACADLACMRGREIQVIPNPVDPVFQPALSSQPDEEQQVVFAGTLAPHKGVWELMRAWPQVVGRVPGANLRLFGKDGKDPASGRHNSERLLESLPPECRQAVRWAGPVTAAQLRDAYLAARVCVFPSLYEAFGLVAAEAMACGRPVIYTKHGPGSEVIEHGVSGLLCDPANTAELAGAITTLLRDRPLAARLGEAALRRVQENFGLPVVLDRNLELYRSLLREPSTRWWMALGGRRSNPRGYRGMERP